MLRKVFLICLARVVALSALALLLGTATAAAASHREQSSVDVIAVRDHSNPSGHGKIASIGVVALEFRFRVSKTRAHVGSVVFRVVNRGKLAHDFKIAGRKTPLIKPGKSAVLRVVFRKAGHYRYVCTVPGHAAAGMKGVLTVT